VPSAKCSLYSVKSLNDTVMVPHTQAAPGSMASRAPCRPTRRNRRRRASSATARRPAARSRSAVSPRTAAMSQPASQPASGVGLARRDRRLERGDGQCGESQGRRSRPRSRCRASGRQGLVGGVHRGGDGVGAGSVATSPPIASASVATSTVVASSPSGSRPARRRGASRGGCDIDHPAVRPPRRPGGDEPGATADGDDATTVDVATDAEAMGGESRPTCPRRRRPPVDTPTRPGRPDARHRDRGENRRP